MAATDFRLCVFLIGTNRLWMMFDVELLLLSIDELHDHLIIGSSLCRACMVS